jgi:hypothetical protein
MFPSADIEAQQAILFETNLMVCSTACKDPVYAAIGSLTDR